MNLGKDLTIVLAIIVISTASVTAVLFLFPYEPLAPPEADDTGSTRQGISEVVSANNQFSMDLYSRYSSTKDGNIFFSPYSISSALAMTYEGAKGQTADEMKSVFYFPENDVLRPNFAAVYNSVNKPTWDYEMRTGNALWLQKDYDLLDDYMERVEKYYGGKAANLDFVGETEQSRQTINNFIEEQTNYKIKDLIPPGSLNAMTRLVLTNAIYFKGTWVLQFDKAKTRKNDFKVSPSKTVKADMMVLTGEKARFNYAETDELQILEMPYKGDDISMLVLLPKEGNMSSVEESLSSEKLDEWRDMLKERKIDVYMPKFKFETKYFMSGDLAAMGMPTAFGGTADFSGMSGEADLFISQVIHQAFVEVNEEGTEAAAATAVIMEFSAVMSDIFRADHPFIFIIQQKDTGNILFLGKVVDPTK